MQTYDDALDSFIRQYRDPIAFLFRTSKGEASDRDLKTMLKYSMGLHLETEFEFKGSFDMGTLRELQRLPKRDRSTETATKALERAEFGFVQNKPLNKVIAPPKKDNPLAKHLDNWRKLRVRKEMKALADASIIVERKTLALTRALDLYRRSPSPSNKHYVTTAVMGLNRALVMSHARARVAGAWAIRSGLGGQMAGQVLERLYFKRARRLEKSTRKLDEWLGLNGFKARVSIGIKRRREIMELELNRAVNQDVSYLPFGYHRRMPKDLEHEHEHR